MNTLTRCLTAVLLAAAFAIALVGCNGNGDTSSSSTMSTSSDTTVSEPTVRPMDEYRDQAESEINEDNAEAELRKLEAEINADASASSTP